MAAKVETGDEVCLLSTIGWPCYLKTGLHDNVFMPLIQKYAPRMEQLLDASATGYFGGQISWVDFYVAGTVQTFTYIDPTTMTSYTKLSDHNQRKSVLDDE